MRNRKSKSGFTLVELLAVMAVIGVLAGMVLGISGYASRRADESRAMADIERIKDILEDYRIRTGRYPPNAASMRDEVRNSNLSFFHETNQLRDPWNRNYEYRLEGRYIIYVYSVGPSGPNNREDFIYTGPTPP